MGPQTITPTLAIVLAFAMTLAVAALMAGISDAEAFPIFQHARWAAA